jgi:UDP-N-acetyl-D-mannosaminuronic acid dehydrogenase
MADTAPIKRIAVMGGAGHVGLPLGLALAKVGFEVTLYDTNDAALDVIQGGRVPFQEEGAEELLRRLLPTGHLLFRSDADCVRGVDALISVIGTPVDEHLNPKLTTFMRAMETILEHLGDGQLLILRSTVSPGTCARLHDWIQRSGKHVHLAFCPERIIEGKALEEIPKLPQIVSGFTPEAVAGARYIFEKLGPEIIELPPEEAELSKLFVNVWRYLKFAVANQFYMIANEFGLDFERILHSVRYNYPRGQDLPQPGFAAGPCLFKDTMQLAAAYHAGFQLGHAAMLVNEGLPDYLVRRLAVRYPLRNMTVGILGMSFKADSDDVRESLSFKLRKLLLMQGATVLCSDPHVPDPSFISPEALVEQTDLIIVGTPHRVFRSLDTREKPLVDIWNLFGRGRMV